MSNIPDGHRCEIGNTSPGQHLRQKFDLDALSRKEHQESSQCSITAGCNVQFVGNSQQLPLSALETAPRLMEIGIVCV